MNDKEMYELARSVFALFGQPVPVTEVSFTVPRSLTGGQGVRYTLVSDEAQLVITADTDELEPLPDGTRQFVQTGYTWFLTASGRATNDGRYNGKIVREVV